MCAVDSGSGTESHTFSAHIVEKRQGLFSVIEGVRALDNRKHEHMFAFYSEVCYAVPS